jgi:hypothetical protein
MDGPLGEVQLDGTIWDLSTQANMALIWMTRKGSLVQVRHGPPPHGLPGVRSQPDPPPFDHLNPHRTRHRPSNEVGACKRWIELELAVRLRMG